MDISTPTARTQPLPLLVRDPKVRARVEATSPEAPDKGFDGAVPEFQPPSGSAAECVIQRFGERYRVELGHEESDLRSHDVRVAAWVYAGRLPGGETAYWLASLGIGEQALTDELFTDAVAARRAA